MQKSLIVGGAKRRGLTRWQSRQPGLRWGNADLPSRRQEDCCEDVAAIFQFLRTTLTSNHSASPRKGNTNASVTIADALGVVVAEGSGMSSPIRGRFGKGASAVRRQPNIAIRFDCGDHQFRICGVKEGFELDASPAGQRCKSANDRQQFRLRAPIIKLEQMGGITAFRNKRFDERPDIGLSVLRSSGLCHCQFPCADFGTRQHIPIEFVRHRVRTAVKS